MRDLTDSDVRLQQKRVHRLVRRWRGLIPGWRVNIEFSREPLDSDGDGWTTNARCDPKWEYLTANITFALQAIADLSEDELERIFVHECCHILVNEMCGPASDEATKHEERVVCGLTSAFLGVRK